MITSLENFQSISDFEICEFNEYSNHAPLYLSLKTYTKLEPHMNRERIFHKWNMNLKDAFLNDMSRDMHLLNRLIDDGTSRNCEPDDIVSSFSQFITDRANPYFEKHSTERNESYFYHENKTVKQKWYNDECKQRRRIYNEALYTYNLNRNDDTRKLMLHAKKDYKYHCRSCKQKYSYEQGRKMNDLRKSRPREFWKQFKHKKIPSSEPDVSTEDFYQYFRSLATDDTNFENAEVSDFLHDFKNTRTDSTFKELDDPITQDEIKRAARQLKSNKACSLDTILNEYFKESINILIGPLEIVFNYILNKNSFPKQWTKGMILPIHKKGNSNDPSNYRGITLVSCFGKLFTVIINERLKKWALENETISDAQFGFKADYSTVDAIFILQSLINNTINSKKKLYACFIDLKRAFDSVYRNGLWYKMIKNGIDGKMFNLIRSIYSEVMSCVKNINTFSDFFKSDVGLMQGEVLSPFLFSLFINDLEVYLQQNQDAGLSLEQLSIYLLLFADDAVILSDSIQGLQSSLNYLEMYCNKWNLSVNIDKTKIVVFRKGGILDRNECWTYAGVNIEIVNCFNYLGIVLSSGGAFIKATNTLAGKALRAMNSLLSITKSMKIPTKIMFSLFDSFVVSILNYGCEIWGFSKAENIERVHRKFCKWYLSVKMSTNNLSLYGELGRFPLYIGRQIRIIKYWLNLYQTKHENCILRTLNAKLRHETEINSASSNWASKIKELLERSGFYDVWLYPESVNINVFLKILECRLRDNYINQWNQGLNLSESLTLYKELKQSFEMSPYLIILQNRELKRAISKLRLSSHSLNIETGRHRRIGRIDRSNRKCTLCNLNDIEDEFHFTLICPAYENIRKQYIDKYFYNRPSVYKFIILLNSVKPKVLKNLALYIIKSFKLRDSLINVNQL